MDQHNIINLENALINFIQNELALVNVINEEEENPYKKRVKEDYLNSLEILTDVDDKICNICFDTINKGDECIKLPCKDGSHYFHKNNNEECGGIMKWLNKNNTCPCCRTEFPYDEYRIDENDENDDNVNDDNVNNDNVNDDNVNNDNVNDENGENDENDVNNIEWQRGSTYAINRIPERILILNNPFINFINEVNREEEDIQRAIELSISET